MNQIPAELGVVASVCDTDAKWAMEAVRIVFRDDATFTVEATNGKLAIRVTGFRDVSVEPGEYLIDAVKFERACKVAKSANKRPTDRVVAIAKDAVCYRDGEWVTVAAGVEGRFPPVEEYIDMKPKGNEIPGAMNVNPKYLALLGKIAVTLETKYCVISHVRDWVKITCRGDRYMIDAIIMSYAPTEKPQ